MTAVQIVLAVAALPIGLTGAWSPCGFSMVETVGRRGDPGGGRTTFAACAAFVPGAAVGGALTFGLLGLLGGALHGVGGTTSYAVAAAIAIAGAALEARGVRIIPQIRRQLPEGWRWSMPLPVASALYGVLLGLGFTTFVLSFGVWALAGISFALGSLTSGLVIGVSFGIGRALPVVVLAPLADHRIGIRCTELMAERPSLYRRARLGDALALAAAATVLVSSGADAAHVESTAGADPSVARGAVAYQRASGEGALVRGGHVTRLRARQPAIGGTRLAVKHPGRVVIRGANSLRRLGTIPAKGADAIAISSRWIAMTQSSNGMDVIRVARLTPKGKPGTLRAVATATHPARLGHPSLDGNTVVYAKARTARSLIIERSLRSGDSHVLLHSRRAQLANPSLRGGRILFERSIRTRQNPIETSAPPLKQRLILSRLDGSHRHTIYRETGHAATLWTTALGSKYAYVTVLKGHRSKIIRIGR
jgi:hypothetical protein